MPKMRNRPKWFDTVRKGDVLRMPSGSYRVVRKVSRHEPKTRSGDYNIFIYFAIMRCSWTGNCHTIYDGTELKHWTHTGHRVRLNSDLDKQIAHDLEYRNRFPEDQLLTCCDVRYAL